LGIGALAGVITLSSTLATSINLNGGGEVKLGHGVTQIHNPSNLKFCAD
jgi:hypothetical protein